VILTNWPEGKVEELRMENHPDHPDMGERTLYFTGRLFIEREDFLENPPPKFFRLAPGREARLNGAYIVKCEGVEKDEAGEVKRLLCSVDLDTKSGSEGANRKVKATLHWLRDLDAVPFPARLYEPILTDDDAAEEIEIDEDGAEVEKPTKDFMSRLNPGSLTAMGKALCEKTIADAEVGARFQFLRMGYFAKDTDSTKEKPVYNRVVPLRDSWQRVKNS
jgi:glutaminyl-tRNA synthetase